MEESGTQPLSEVKTKKSGRNICQCNFKRREEWFESNNIGKEGGQLVDKYAIAGDQYDEETIQ